jgi:hypothetical protein
LRMHIKATQDMTSNTSYERIKATKI